MKYDSDVKNIEIEGVTWIEHYGSYKTTIAKCLYCEISFCVLGEERGYRVKIGSSVLKGFSPSFEDGAERVVRFIKANFKSFFKE